MSVTTIKDIADSVIENWSLIDASSAMAMKDNIDNIVMYTKSDLLRETDRDVLKSNIKKVFDELKKNKVKTYAELNDADREIMQNIIIGYFDEQLHPNTDEGIKNNVDFIRHKYANSKNITVKKSNNKGNDVNADINGIISLLNGRVLYRNNNNNNNMNNVEEVKFSYNPGHEKLWDKITKLKDSIKNNDGDKRLLIDNFLTDLDVRYSDKYSENMSEGTTRFFLKLKNSIIDKGYAKFDSDVKGVISEIVSDDYGEGDTHRKNQLYYDVKTCMENIKAYDFLERSIKDGIYVLFCVGMHDNKYFFFGNSVYGKSHITALKNVDGIHYSRSYDFRCSSKTWLFDFNVNTLDKLYALAKNEEVTDVTEDVIKESKKYFSRTGNVNSLNNHMHQENHVCISIPLYYWYFEKDNLSVFMNSMADLIKLGKCDTCKNNPFYEKHKLNFYNDSYNAGKIHSHYMCTRTSECYSKFDYISKLSGNDVDKDTDSEYCKTDACNDKNVTMTCLIQSNKLFVDSVDAIYKKKDFCLLENRLPLEDIELENNKANTVKNCVKYAYNKIKFLLGKRSDHYKYFMSLSLIYFEKCDTWVNIIMDKIIPHISLNTLNALKKYFDESQTNNNHDHDQQYKHDPQYKYDNALLVDYMKYKCSEIFMIEYCRVCTCLEELGEIHQYMYETYNSHRIGNINREYSYYLMMSVFGDNDSNVGDDFLINRFGFNEDMCIKHKNLVGKLKDNDTRINQNDNIQFKCHFIYLFITFIGNTIIARYTCFVKDRFYLINLLASMIKDNKTNISFHEYVNTRAECINGERVIYFGNNKELKYVLDSVYQNDYDTIIVFEKINNRYERKGKIVTSYTNYYKMTYETIYPIVYLYENIHNKQKEYYAKKQLNPDVINFEGITDRNNTYYVIMKKLNSLKLLDVLREIKSFFYISLHNDAIYIGLDCEDYDIVTNNNIYGAKREYLVIKKDMIQYVKPKFEITYDFSDKYPVQSKYPMPSLRELYCFMFLKTKVINYNEKSSERDIYMFDTNVRYPLFDFYETYFHRNEGSMHKYNYGVCMDNEQHMPNDNKCKVCYSKIIDKYVNFINDVVAKERTQTGQQYFRVWHNFGVNDNQQKTYVGIPNNDDKYEEELKLINRSGHYDMRCDNIEQVKHNFGY